MTSRSLARAAGVAALAVALAAASIGSDVYEGGEAREALVVRAMLHTGDWILPLWNGSVIPSKPPLFHWLVAGAAHVGGAGVTERTLRAPSVALAGLVVLLVFLAGRAWARDEVGLLAALVLATTPQFLGEATDGRVDMTLTAAITGGQLAFLGALRGGRAWAVVLALCLALAMLAKGPVGPGLVLLTALLFSLRERRLGDALRLVRPLPVAVFLLLAGGWYTLAYLHRGADFVAKQIVSENGEALLGSSRFPHRSPLFYLLPLLLGGLPWTLLLPWAVARAWRGAPERRYCLVWAAVVLAFFSLAPLKRGAYLLPLRPALALLTGWWIADVARNAAPAGRLVPLARTLARGGAGLGLLVAMAAGAAALDLVSRSAILPLAARHEIDAAVYLDLLRSAAAPIGALGLGAAVAAGVAGRALARDGWRSAALASAAAVACAALLVGHYFAPARAAQKSIRDFAEAVHDRVGDGDRLALLTSAEEIPFIFYLGSDVPVLGDPGRRPPGLEAGWYVLERDRWRAWDTPAGFEEVVASPHVFSRHRRDLVLVRRR